MANVQRWNHSRDQWEDTSSTLKDLSEDEEGTEYQVYQFFEVSSGRLWGESKGQADTYHLDNGQLGYHDYWFFSPGSENPDDGDVSDWCGFVFSGIGGPLDVTVKLTIDDSSALDSADTLTMGLRKATWDGEHFTDLEDIDEPLTVNPKAGEIYTFSATGWEQKEFYDDPNSALVFLAEFKDASLLRNEDAPSIVIDPGVITGKGQLNYDLELMVKYSEGSPGASDDFEYAPFYRGSRSDSEGEEELVVINDNPEEFEAISAYVPETPGTPDFILV